VAGGDRHHRHPPGAPLAGGPKRAGSSPQGRNHLKQIDLALHNYHAAHEPFPPGAILMAQVTTANSTWCTSGGSMVGDAPWTVLVLPYLE
jgi:hypothetical protein